MLQPSRFKTKAFLPLLGGVVGLFYGLLDEGYLDHLESPSPFTLVIHEIVDLVLPVLLGVMIGVWILFFRRQKRLNQSLSLEKKHLEKELLMNLVISQMLHEIQNPIHNISAVFEDAKAPLSDEQQAMVRRNLERLNELKKKYGQWDWASQFDADRPVDLSGWFERWSEDRVESEPKTRRIETSGFANVRLAVHPVLLDQIFSVLLENASEACVSAGDRALIRIEASNDAECVRLRFSNNGSPFPEDILKAQGRQPVASRHGLGLGLVLLHKMVEQVNGKMALSNEKGLSVVTLELPGSAG